MASFDIFCEPHMGCIKKAVDRANQLIPKRYDWQDTSALYALKANSIEMSASSHLQLDQMLQELCWELRKELVSLAFIAVNRPKRVNGEYSVRLTIERGLSKAWAEHIERIIKSYRIMASCTYQNNEVHVVTDTLDEAQQLIGQLRLESFDIPVHYRNLIAH